jgi:hypothetical protein
MPRVRPPSCTSSSLARSSPPSRPSVSPPRTTIHRPRRARRSRSGVRICRVSRHTFRSDVAAARVPMTDRDPSALSTIVRRLQRRDRRVQEHLVHRVGCRWPGQGTRARSTTTPSRFQRRACASNERVSTGEPRRARSTRGFEKVPDFLFFARGVLTFAHPPSRLDTRTDSPSVEALLPEHPGFDLRRGLQRPRPRVGGSGRAAPHVERG